MKKANRKEINGKQIEEMLKKAWGNFKDYYDKRASEYSKKMKLSEKEAKNEHWICWNEDDLMLHLGRFFYQQLYKQLGRNSGIEVHLKKNLTPKNFKGYEFENDLEKFNKQLGVKYVELDLIIAYEDHKSQFLLCAEAKCFHASEESVSRGERTAEGVIEEDIARLVALKELKIAEEVVFILFDDYYYLENPEKHEAIQEILAKAEKQAKGIKIKVLYHKSEAKMLNTRRE